LDPDICLNDGIKDPMRRNPRQQKITKAKQRPRRQRDADLPVVPTFQPAPGTNATQPSAVAAIDDNPIEEAVRRMVEAAYT